MCGKVVRGGLVGEGRGREGVTWVGAVSVGWGKGSG